MNKSAFCTWEGVAVCGKLLSLKSRKYAVSDGCLKKF